MELATALNGSEIDAFYTFNRERLARATAAFAESFPGKVLYAVKANSLPQVIRTVNAYGAAGFDIASIGEARLVNAIAPRAQSWFMNPVKSRRDIEQAYRELDIRNFAVDCQTELHKLFEALPVGDPGMRVFVRLNAGGTAAVFDLNSKFGASQVEAVRLLDEIAGRTKWSTGLAFHTGSQTMTVAPYLEAMGAAVAVMEKTCAAPSVLDIGGGFPGSYLNVPTQPLPAMLAAIRAFAAESEHLRRVELVCEPGRALVFDSMSLFARVVLRRDNALYCGAGIYSGLLSAQQFLQFPARAWRGARLLDSDSVSDFIIFGPTCDSIDRLAFPYALPEELQEGDWLEFEHVGAYSENVRCAFNGFSVEHLILVDDRELGWFSGEKAMTDAGVLPVAREPAQGVLF
jgi:ornithine decarboxylase